MLAVQLIATSRLAFRPADLTLGPAWFREGRPLDARSVDSRAHDGEIRASSHYCHFDLTLGVHAVVAIAQPAQG